MQDIDMKEEYIKKLLEENNKLKKIVESYENKIVYCKDCIYSSSYRENELACKISFPVKIVSKIDFCSCGETEDDNR